MDESLEESIIRDEFNKARELCYKVQKLIIKDKLSTTGIAMLIDMLEEGYSSQCEDWAELMSEVRNLHIEAQLEN